MKLHENTDLFKELIEGTAQSIGLPEVYIEKDYWITKALRYLSESDHVDDAVFKGGTSLSKAHRLIHRFSEDIDLAIFAKDLGDSKRKRLLKSVETEASTGLELVEDDPRTSKGSSFRKTVYRYPRSISEGDFGQASPELLIEVSSFTTPEPFEQKTIQTFIADSLGDQGRQDLIDEYDLHSYQINVLSIRRTLVEKILGVIKDSYHDDPVNRLSIRIRHLYDICQILKSEESRSFLESSAFNDLCETCIADEKNGGFDDADFLNNPLIEAPIFSQFDAWSGALSAVYDGDFADLVYGDKPSMAKISDSLKRIKAAL